MPEFLVIAVAVFGVWLFATAAVHKLRAPGWYAGLLARYLDMSRFSRPLVLLIALSEAGCAVLLIVPATRTVGLLLAAALLLAYALLMSLQLWRGRLDMNCGCAGPASDTTISAGLVYRNLACATVAAMAALLPLQATTWSVPVILISGLVGIFMVLVYLACEQLIANAQRFAGAS